MQRFSPTIAAALAFAIWGAACEPDGRDLAREQAETAAEFPVEEIAREERQSAPPGEVVASMLRSAEPGVTVYDPPPDLSRPDLGVVYIPNPPSPAPASGMGDTVGLGQPAARPAPAAPIASPRDTTGMRPR